MGCGMGRPGQTRPGRQSGVNVRPKSASINEIDALHSRIRASVYENKMGWPCSQVLAGCILALVVVLLLLLIAVGYMACDNLHKLMDPSARVSAWILCRSGRVTPSGSRAFAHRTSTDDSTDWSYSDRL